MKKYIIFITLLVVAIGIAIGLNYQKNKSIESAYNNAISSIQNAEYENTLSEFEKANPDKIDRSDFSWDMSQNKITGCYKNTLHLYAYALAQIEYNLDDKSMNQVKKYLELIPEEYDGELCEEIKNFKNNFQSEYAQYILEQRRIADEEAKKQQQRQQEIEESLKKQYKNRIPEKGMSESVLKYTAMGPNYEYESVEVGKGKRINYILHEYRWKIENGHTLLFVECKDGIVTNVIKYYTDSHWTKEGLPIFSSKKASANTVKKSTKKNTTKYDDPYNVNDYSTEEDFYYDNYDDFSDYEEAEDYYNEHHED